MNKFSLAAECDADQKAIIVAFHSKWYEPVQNHAIKEVFRKMGPTKFAPDWMYAYFTTPLSSIAAKMRLSSLEYLPLDEAVEFSGGSGLSASEIRAYAKDYTNLLVYHVKTIHPAKSPIALSVLTERFDFWPSSNFVPLSMEGCVELDALLGIE